MVNSVFGYGSLENQFLEDHQLDPIEICKVNWWHFQKGLLVTSFWRGGNVPKVQFGASLTKKQIKQIRQEQRQKPK